MVTHGQTDGRTEEIALSPFGRKERWNCYMHVRVMLRYFGIMLRILVKIISLHICWFFFKFTPPVIENVTDLESASANTTLSHWLISLYIVCHMLTTDLDLSKYDWRRQPSDDRSRAGTGFNFLHWVIFTTEFYVYYIYSFKVNSAFIHVHPSQLRMSSSITMAYVIPTIWAFMVSLVLLLDEVWIKLTF